MNTKRRGEFGVYIVELSKNSYVGFCPEFAIVKEGNDFENLKNDLLKAGKVYLEAVSEKNLNNMLLNRSGELPEKYQILSEIIRRSAEGIDNSNRIREKLPKNFQTALNKGKASFIPAYA